MAFKKSSGSILADTLFADLTPQALLRQRPSANVKKAVERSKEKQRLNSLLVHQQAFLEDKTTRHLGLVAGFGSGKSYSMTIKMLQLALDNPGCTGIAMEPTFGMLSDILVPQLTELWDDWGVDYEYFRGSQEIKLKCPDGKTSHILLRSFENYQRCRGINAAWACVDEVDTVKPKLATDAFRLLQGRIRTGMKPQICVCSTPEGFAWMYDFFVTNNDPSKRLIKAKTTDNPYLPPEYIQSLRDQYPPSLIESYLNGEFVSLAQCVIFQDFNRKINNSTETYRNDEDIHIGLDFNFGICMGIVFVVRNEGQQQVVHAVKSFSTNDTYETVTYIQRTFGSAVQRRRVWVYPDASGASAHTSSTTTDHQILRQGNLTVVSDRKNPDPRETFAQCNLAFHRNILRVNHQMAPDLAEALERWAYDDQGRPIKNNTPDHSHAGDAFRYCYWHLGNGAGRRAFRGARIY